MLKIKQAQTWDISLNSISTKIQFPLWNTIKRMASYSLNGIDVISGFEMPLDIEVNGIKTRIFPTTEIQSVKIPIHSVVHIRDWEFLISKKENSALSG
jgi:hypothetical protein